MHTEPHVGDHELSNLEYAMIVSANGFFRWVVHCAEAAGARGLSTLDVLVLHMVNHRARSKKLSDICLIMNVEDAHTVSYSLKKLEEQGYVSHKYNGRERVYLSSSDGDKLCEQYRSVRRDNLVRCLREDGVDIETITGVSTMLNRIARYYAHASRIALVGQESDSSTKQEAE